MAFPEGMPLPPFPSAPVTPVSALSSIATSKKLKKARKGTEGGYESDGGYLSERGRKQTDKKKKAKHLKEGNLDLDTNSLESNSLVVPEERKRKKSLVDAVKGSMRRKEKETDIGYLTDGHSSKSNRAKSKVKPGKNKDPEETYYETDGEKKRTKTRMFFKLSKKISKPDMTESSRDEENLPKEQVPLPIADRFATPLSPKSVSAAFVSEDSQLPSPIVPSSDSAAAIGETRSNISIGAVPSLSFQPFSAATDASALSIRSHSPPLSTSLSQPSSPQAPHLLSRPTEPSRDSHSSSSSGGSISQSRASAISSHNIPQPSSSSTSFSTSYSHPQHPSPNGGHGIGIGSGSAATSPSHQCPSVENGYGQTQKVDTYLPSSASEKNPVFPSSIPVSAPHSAVNETFKRPIISYEITNDISTIPLMRIQRQSQTETDEQSWVEVEADSPEDAEKIPNAIIPPTAPVNIGMGFGLRPKPNVENINLLGLRPSTISPASAVTSSQSTPLSSPAFQHGFPPFHLLSRQGSPAENSNPTQMRPRALFSPPNSATSPSNLSPSSTLEATAPWNTRPSHPTLNLRHSHQFGPRGIGNASPNVLAYYDIPLPSPPPTGPLPQPPPMNGDDMTTNKNRSPSPWRRSRNPNPTFPATDANAYPSTLQLPAPSQLRQRFLDRSPRILPPDEAVRGAAGHGVGALNIRRGKDSPFPSRPFSPKRNELDPLIVGRKHRDLSPPSSSSSHPAGENQWERDVSILPVQPLNRKDSLGSWVEFVGLSNKGTNEDSGELEDEDDFSDNECLRDSLDTDRLSSESGMHSVLNRFVDNARRSEEYVPSETALARNRSFEALNPTYRGSVYAWDDGTTIGDRTSRWSGSIYSRSSLLDEEESNTARDRFVKRVEAMLAAEAKRNVGQNEISGDDAPPAVGIRGRPSVGRGRGRGEYVPPVPKIPDAFASPGKIPAGQTWNRF